MIKNKHISKITMLTCLMLGGIVNAQEFYTCVPKKSWWKDVVAESVKSGIQEIKKDEWVFVKKLPMFVREWLTAGMYRIQHGNKIVFPFSIQHREQIVIERYSSDNVVIFFLNQEGRYLYFVRIGSYDSYDLYLKQ